MTHVIPRSYVVATVRIKVKPLSVAKMQVIAHDLMTASRTEDGCLLYQITQSQADVTLFFIYMVWRDEESYRKHAAAPFVRAFDHEIAHEILEKRFSIEKWHSL
jgi:quinol monooxygenase YgiN